MTGSNYVVPTWKNKSNPGINATRLQNISDSIKNNETDINELEDRKADKGVSLSDYGIVNAYTKDEATSKFVDVTGDTMSGNLDVGFQQGSTLGVHIRTGGYVIANGHGSSASMTPSEVSVGKHKLTLKADKSELDSISDSVTAINNDLTELADEGYIQNKNLICDVIKGSYIASNGAITVDASYNIAIAKVEAGKSYVFSSNDTNFALFSSKPTKSSVDVDNRRRVSSDRVVSSIPSGVNYIGFLYGASYETPQIEEGTVATSYVKPIPTNTELGESVVQINNDFMDEKMLGWSVPNDCPIQNTESNGVFTQKVGRVDLGSLDWTYDTSSATPCFRTSRLTIGVKSNSDKMLCNKYESLFNFWNQSNHYGYIATGNSYLNISDSNYNQSTISSFKSSLSGVYLYYELDTPITTKIDGNEAVVQINNNFMDEKMLGWSVPNDCPIQNTESNGVFTQKVGRVDLGSLTWTYTNDSGHERMSSSTKITDAKVAPSWSDKANAYLIGYTTVSYKGIYEHSSNNIVCVQNQESYIHIYSTSMGTDVNAFKNSMKGKYLYYELATPITTKIDGNEAVVQLNENLTEIKVGTISTTHSLDSLSYLKKVGKMVVLTASVTLAADVVAWEPILNIPTEFAPCGYYFARTMGNASLSILANGQVQVRSALTSGSKLMFSATYMTN